MERCRSVYLVMCLAEAPSQVQTMTSWPGSALSGVESQVRVAIRVKCGITDLVHVQPRYFRKYWLCINKGQY